MLKTDLLEERLAVVYTLVLALVAPSDFKFII